MSNILIFSFYPPASKAGGPVKSIESLFKEIHNEHKVFIVSPSVDIDGEYIDYNGYSLELKYYPNINIKDNISFIWLLRFCKKNCIDFIYLNSFFEFKNLFIVIAASYFLNVKTVLAPRGQLEPGALKTKKFLKYFYIKFFNMFLNSRIDIYHSTSVDESLNISKLLKIPSFKILQISNIRRVLVEDSFFTKSDKKEGIIKLVFFSRIVPKKNLLKLLTILSTCNVKGIYLDIYGNIEDKDYWIKCEKVLMNSPNKDNFSYMGIPSNTELFHVLNKYDVFIFPTLSENFGHVIIEALASGLPVILNNTTPFSNDVLNFNIGSVIDFNNEDGVLDLINHYQKLEYNDYIGFKNNLLNYLLHLDYVNDLESNKYKKLFTK